MDTSHVLTGTKHLTPCQECKTFFWTSRIQCRFCESCRKARRKEKVREYVALHRERQRTGEALPRQRDEERRKLKEAIRTEQGVKVVKMPCGHELRFRIAPIEGEWLWCARCGTDVEFTAGINRPVCKLGAHRMTPFNKTAHGHCRRCADATLANS